VDLRTHFNLETRVRRGGHLILALPYTSCHMFAKLSSYLSFNSLGYKMRILITPLTEEECSDNFRR